VRYLGAVKDDAVFKLARVAKNDAVTDDHIFPDIAAASDFAVVSDPGWSLNSCPVFDQGSAAYVDIFADKGAAKNASVNSGFKAKLKITSDLLKRVPHVRAVVKDCAVFRLVEIEEFPWIKHKALARPRLRKNSTHLQPVLRFKDSRESFES
jgi:hypothetical protein